MSWQDRYNINFITTTADPYILHNIEFQVPNPRKNLPEWVIELKINYRWYTIGIL
jgi:hypothetical protein